MSALPKKAHWPPIYIYLQSALIAVATWWITQNLYQDDSYITLVYVRNWLEGFGLVWSRGDVPVEGYSNFLFLAVIAGLGWLGVDLVLASRLVNFIGYIGLVWCLVWFTRAIYHKYYASTEKHYAYQVNSALCVGLVASSVPILTWCMGGLEAVFFAFLLTYAVCRILWWLESGAEHKYAFVTGVIFALAAMTRLEALMVWGITGIVLGLFWLSGRMATHLNFAKLVLLGAGFLALFVPYVAWKYSYYGDVLPNTYYAKAFAVSPELLTHFGWFYAFQFLYVPPLLVVCFIGLFLYLYTKTIPPRSLLYLISLLALFFWHIIASGGDHMPYLRFFVPVIPLLALALYYMCNALIEKRERAFRDVSGALIVLCIFQFGYVSFDGQLSRGALSGKAVAPYVNANWPEGSTIAVNPAGALPYYAPNYHYIDMLGLNDKHIAQREIYLDDADMMRKIRHRPIGHLKGDGEYVFSRKPDYIIFGDAWGEKKPRFLSDIELFELEGFAQHYKRVELLVNPPAGLIEPLHVMAEDNLKYKGSPRYVHGPIMEKDQLYFIYYERIN